MSYKTLLLHLDERERRRERLDMAVRLAEAFDAQLVGAFASPKNHVPSPVLAEAGPEMAQVEARNRRELVSRAEKDFIETARRGGVRFHWEALHGTGYDDIVAGARCADLVITGQPELDDASHRAFVGALLLSAGRPVLLIPYAGRFTKLGQRILIAWNGSRESARAVGDALPFLARASSVEVMEFETQPGRGFSEAVSTDVGAYLARHGVKVTLSRQTASDVDVGNLILSRAADYDSDLIVMGGYGHSRMRELILGGVTRTLLESMTVPVLMSH